MWALVDTSSMAATKKMVDRQDCRNRRSETKENSDTTNVPAIAQDFLSCCWHDYAIAYNKQ